MNRPLGSFGGVEIPDGTWDFKTKDPDAPPPRKPDLTITLTMKAEDMTGFARRMRALRKLAPYLTPRKRRRIKRRGERDYLERMAWGMYGIKPIPGEFTKVLRARCLGTWERTVNQ